MRPIRPAGVVSSPVPWPGMASSGTPDRLAKCEKKARSGTYSPKGTRWTFSKTPTTRPVGPHATTSFLNELDETVSVTPASTVERRRRASDDRYAPARVPERRGPTLTTSSGQTTICGGSVDPSSRRVAETSAARTLDGATSNWLVPRLPPPCTSATLTLPVAEPPDGAKTAPTPTAS